MEKFEKEIKEYTGSYIKKLFKDININLLRRFNNDFKQDKAGNLRNWVNLEEAFIRELWLNCKMNVESIFESFKYIEIPNELSSKIASHLTPGSQDEDIAEINL